MNGLSRGVRRPHPFAFRYLRANGRYATKVSRLIQQCQETLPQAIRDIAWRAHVRLCKRYRRLVAKGKSPNVAVVVIARELSALMWAIVQAVPLAPPQGAMR